MHQLYKKDILENYKKASNIIIVKAWTLAEVQSEFTGKWI